MVDISIVNGTINQLITGGAPPCTLIDIERIYHWVKLGWVVWYVNISGEHGELTSDFSQGF